MLNWYALVFWATFFEPPSVERQIVEDQVTKSEESSSPSIKKVEPSKKIERDDAINSVGRVKIENSNIKGSISLQGAVIDDRNTYGSSLGERRLSTPLKNLYDLKYQISNFGGLIKHRGRFYVDSNGKFFIYENKENILKETLKKNYNIKLNNYQSIHYKILPTPRLHINNADLEFDKIYFFTDSTRNCSSFIFFIK